MSLAARSSCAPPRRRPAARSAWGPLRPLRAVERRGFMWGARGVAAMGWLGYVSATFRLRFNYHHVSHVGRFALPPGSLHCPARHSGGRSGRTSLSGVPARRGVGGGRAAWCVGGPTRAKLALGCTSAPHRRTKGLFGKNALKVFKERHFCSLLHTCKDLLSEFKKSLSQTWW